MRGGQIRLGRREYVASEFGGCERSVEVSSEVVAFKRRVSNQSANCKGTNEFLFCFGCVTVNCKRVRCSYITML